VRTLSEYLASIEKDKAWRRKEIMTLVIVSKSPKRSISEQTLIRSGVPLIYGHWEGFVKKCTRDYLDFLSSRNESTHSLSGIALALAYRSKLRDAAEERSTKRFAEIINELRTFSIVRLFKMSDSLMTESNLSYEVFCKIYDSLGLDHLQYSTKSTFLNETLLRNRNIIAHGEYLTVTMDLFQEICTTIMSLLELVPESVRKKQAKGQKKV
jgi:hypothetical protein